jgi:hypothetical protein
VTTRPASHAPAALGRFVVLTFHMGVWAKLRPEEIPQDGEDKAPDNGERGSGRYEGQAEVEVEPNAGHARVHQWPE